MYLASFAFTLIPALPFVYFWVPSRRLSVFLFFVTTVIQFGFTRIPVLSFVYSQVASRHLSVFLFLVTAVIQVFCIASLNSYMFLSRDVVFMRGLKVVSIFSRMTLQYCPSHVPLFVANVSLIPHTRSRHFSSITREVPFVSVDCLSLPRSANRVPILTLSGESMGRCRERQWRR